MSKYLQLLEIGLLCTSFDRVPCNIGLSNLKYIYLIEFSSVFTL